MLNRILLPVIFMILGYGFWLSPEIKIVSAGVAIFLLGMLSLEKGFSAFSGGMLEKLLRRATGNKWQALGLGMLSTTIMQSSSLVSIIAISFLSAGLITLTAGIGIVFGANLGTTTGAWLVAGFGLKVNIASYAMPMLVFGTILLFQHSRNLKGLGYVLAGLGLLFLGIHYMKEGFEAIKETIDIARFAMSGYTGVLLFSLVGMFATVVMQSSHATLVLIITALAAQQVTYENALALAIGANVGTTVTAILGALGANASGKRLAAAHLIFNLVTGIVSVALIYQLVQIVDRISQFAGISDTNYTLKLAVFHTIFNLIGVVIMLPFVQPLVARLEKAIPEHVVEVDQPRYLSSASAAFADTAIEAVRNETLRVYDAGINIMVNGLGLRRIERGDALHLSVTRAAHHESGLKDIDAMYEQHVKTIYSAIIAFISETAFSRRDEQTASLQWLREANARIVESIKDTKHLQKNLRRYIDSSNQDMKDGYDTIRRHIASTIEVLNEMRGQQDGVMDMLGLDALKQATEDHRNSTTENVARLIGLRRISPEMGSSLLNDSRYAHDICMNMAKAAQTLFGASERELLLTARDVTLDDSELAELAEAVSTKNAEALKTFASGDKRES